MNSVNGFCQHPDLRQCNRSVCNGISQSVGKRFSHAISALATGDIMCTIKRTFSMLYMLVY
jgi:hypothetical protein